MRSTNPAVGCPAPAAGTRPGAARSTAPACRTPDRHRVDEVGAVAAHRHADRPGVRHRHRDRVHPGRGRHLERRRPAEHGRGEPLPLEVGLVAGEHEELLADLVVREVEAEPRRTVVGQVVLLEEHDRAAGAVVEQRVGVELATTVVSSVDSRYSLICVTAEPASAKPVSPATRCSPGGTWTSG